MADPGERQARVSGAALVGLHALAAIGLLGRCDRPALSMSVATPGGVSIVDDGRPAGLHREHVEARYRGGFVERVGRSVIAGPLQTPADPACGVRLTLGQSLLDQLEAPLAAEVEAGLAGQLGFREVTQVDVRFGAPGILIDLELAFARARVPVAVVVTTAIVDGRLDLRASTRARVLLRSSILAGAVDLLGQRERLDDLVTRVAASEVDKVLGPIAALLGEPPPVPVGDGRTLALRYCRDQAVAIVASRSLSVPLAVPVAPDARGFAPIRLPAKAPPGPPDGDLALDVSLDAVNAVLFETWRSGQLDLHVARAGLDTRFNESDEVRELLTLRAGPPRLALPPILTAQAGELPLSLALEAELELRDGALVTPARLFVRLGLDLRRDRDETRARVALADLALTCAPRPDRLVACYPLLVERARAGADRLYPAVTSTLVAWFDELVAGRSFGGLSGAPAFVIDGARLSHRIDSESGWFRVEMRGRLSH